MERKERERKRRRRAVQERVSKELWGSECLVVGYPALKIVHTAPSSLDGQIGAQTGMT